MPRKPPKPAPVVVKRPPQERKRLTPELEAFAASDQTRLRIRRPPSDQGRVADPREGYAIAGVANRDARTVYGSRVDELRELWKAGAASDADRLVMGERLYDLKRLALWRARRVTGFDALVEEVLGIPLPEATALSDAAAVRLGEPASELSERDVALWLRTEAGLLEGDPKARASVSGGVLSLSIALSAASLGLAGAGAKHMPLARAQREASEVASAPGTPDAPAAPEVEAGELPIKPLVHVPAEPAGARLLRRKPVSAGAVAQPELDETMEMDKEEEDAPSGAPQPRRPERPRRAEPAFQKRAFDRPTFQKDGGGRAEPSRREADRPRFQKRAGDRPAFQKQGGARPDRSRRDGDRPQFQKRDGGRPRFQKRLGAQESRAGQPFEAKPRFAKPEKAGKTFGQSKPFGKSKGFGERKRFGNKGEGGATVRTANKAFKKKPNDDEG